MELITCQYCTTENPSKAKFCKSCGKRLKCESCGEPLEKDARNCIICGEPIENKASLNNRNTVDYSNNNGNVNLKIDVTDETAKSSITEIFRSIGISGNNIKQLGTSDSNNLNQKTQDVPYEEVIQPEDKDSFTPIDRNKPDEYPHITDVKNTIECSEADWIAIYAFYNSNYGQDTFTQEEVRAAYFEDRKTETRRKNFSSNWKHLFKVYFKTQKDGIYAFKPDSIPSLLNIITDNTKSKVAKSSSSREKKSTNSSPSIRSKTSSITPEEFDISKSSTKSSLKDFLAETGVSDKPKERVLAIAYYIINKNKTPHFTSGNIDFAYKALQLGKQIKDIDQFLRNVKHNYLWFTQNANGWELTRVGSTYLEDNFLNKDDK